MGPDRIVDALPLEELRIEPLYGPRAVIDFVKFLGMGTIGSLYRTIEFRTFGRELEECDASALTFGFKLCEKFRTAIDLNRTNRKRS